MSNFVILQNQPELGPFQYAGAALFGLSRHINYFGYTVWRTGFALASGSWILAALSASWFTFDFVARGIPVLDEYCSKRVSVRENERMEQQLTQTS
jgi:protein-S-isoprenylcysteine O-methyltransferase Ste14